MATIDSNLYPPIFKQSYVPAFIYNQKCRIYFSISTYNTISELHTIAPVQIIIQNQKSNQYALDTTKYPSGIMLTTLKKDSSKTGDNQYYIEISSEDMQNGFSLNEYYKVQIRFTGAAAENPSEDLTGLDGWLSANIQHFSQWSTVVLIYGISKPSISLIGFKENEKTNFTTTDINVVGKVIFENENDKEKVKNFQVYLYDNENNLLENSGIIYTKDKNNIQINYLLKYNLQIQQDYILKINIVTDNYYTFTEPLIYNFTISRETMQRLDAEMKYGVNNDSGFMKIYLKNKYFTLSQQSEENLRYSYSDNTATLTGKSLYLTLSAGNSSSPTYLPNDTTIATFQSSEFMVDDDGILLLYNKENTKHDMSNGTSFIFERASSKNNFKMWEEVDFITIDQQDVLDITWFDYTIQPGIWYKYKIIRINSMGQRTSFIEINDPIMVTPQDIFLEANGKQLRIRFDPQVDNFKYTVSESLTETIGSPYPYIKRNGNVNYRTFTLSGTIVSFMNVKDNLLEASKTDIYKESKDLYNQYNKDNNINIYNDYIYERQFRKQVMSFLYNNDVKLYRSLPQGNILVKLMDISFTPNPTLGRLIYSFSCTACQIGECNIDNYKKYNIIKGKYKYTI